MVEEAAEAAAEVPLRRPFGATPFRSWIAQGFVGQGSLECVASGRIQTFGKSLG